MNKLLRQFLSGGSLAALQLCALGGGVARAAGTTINNTRTNVVIATHEDFILVSNTGHINGSLTNNGTVGPSTTAIEVASGGVITGSIINSVGHTIEASRTGILVQAGASVGGINNAGKILVATSSGSAFGIHDVLSGAVAQTLTNSGTIQVSVQTSRTNSRLSNTAHGVVQSAPNAGGGVAGLTLSNSGLVSLNAVAKASNNTTTARVTADAETGLGQKASNGSSLTLNLTNSAIVSLHGTADAIATGTGALAQATAGRAIYQHAQNSTLVAGSVISETVTNSGMLSLGAAAHASNTAGGDVTANAFAGSAIRQSGLKASDIELSITNSGQMSLAAGARATSTDDPASANATVGPVLRQKALNNATSAALATKANLSITNSGAVSIAATAVAKGTHGAANASIQFALQSVNQGGVIAETLTNTNSGTLNLRANASESAYLNQTATADARVRNVFHQVASDGGVVVADSAITQAITNTASLLLAAAANNVAHFDSSRSVDASAKISDVFNQAADHVITATQGITNTGSITAGAKATGLLTNAFGSGADYRGQDDAAVIRIFNQQASGTSATARQAGSKASQTISNSGVLTLTATVNSHIVGASARSSHASANGRINEVFDQFTRRTANVVQSISNTGGLVLNATAAAKMTASRTDKAFANANINAVISQSADFSGLASPAGTSANQTITNSGSLHLGVAATAFGDAPHDGIVDARAEVQDVMSQFAERATSITQSIINSGAIAIAASATATDLSRFQRSGADVAQASAEEILFQEATGDGTHTPASVVKQSITNSGSLSIALKGHMKIGVAAQASGEQTASAKLFAENLLDQEVENAVNVTQTLSNSGAITINAAAVATAVGVGHKVHATAKASDLLVQFDTADNLARSNASQTMTNSGAVSLTLAATAKGALGEVNDTVAHASAKAVRLFEQSAREVLGAAQTLTNSGSVTIKATAVATGTGVTAWARATAEAQDIFLQRFSADTNAGGTISQSISNTGNLSITLAASGNGQQPLTTSREGASARANAADLLSQQAAGDSNNSGSLNQTMSNSGSITLSQTASVVTTGKRDQAFADLSDMITQRGEDAGSITQAIVSSGAVNATLVATAKGALDNAVADIDLGSLLRQYGSESDALTQNLTVSSSGSITITATATANSAVTGGHGASANVGLENSGIKQFAENIDGAVAQTMVLNAPIKLTFSGIATGVTRASGEAFLRSHFAKQHGSGGGMSLSQSMTNTGAVTIALSGKAKANTGAGAEATIDEAVFFQSGENTGKPVTQTMANSGNLSLSLVAVATATKGAGSVAQAGADADMNSELMSQIARANHLGTLTQSLTNSGNISIAQTALANGKTRATADAGRDTLIRQQGALYTDVNQSLSNTGNITLTASAKALGPADAGANAADNHYDPLFLQAATSAFITTAASIGVNQTITNSGALVIKSAATATGAGRVTAEATGKQFIGQRNRDGGSLVTQKISNSGAITLTFGGKAKTTGNGTALAELRLEDGMFSQDVSQSGAAGQIANLSITNSGNITLAMGATATGVTRAHAIASEEGIFRQEAGNSTAGTLSLTNSGTIAVSNLAKASDKGQAAVTAGARFVNQEVIAENNQNFTNAALSFANSGKVTLAAVGSAIATNSAKAHAKAFGVDQQFDLENNLATSPAASLSLTNSGSISLSATAKGTAGNRARVNATATGAEQVFEQTAGSGAHPATLSGPVSFANSGTISVTASAAVLSATPHVTLAGTTPSQVIAKANGLEVFAEGANYKEITNSGTTRGVRDTVAPVLSLSNSGAFTVAAVAVGAGVDGAKATAIANGFKVQVTSITARFNTSTHAVGTARHFTKQHSGQVVNGAISNSGTFAVNATAAGGKATAEGLDIAGSTHAESVTNATGGTLSVTASGATALARGIDLHNLVKAQKTTDLNNTGTFNSNEHTHTRTNNGPSSAVTGNVTNSGTITVSATGTVSELAGGIGINAVKISDTILNSGALNVTAAGPAALAFGVHLYASNIGTSHDFIFQSQTGHPNVRHTATQFFHTRLSTVAFSGTLNNTGTITVVAKATTGNGVADGIDIDGYSLQGGTILNSGTINATASGPTATANDIFLDASSGAVTVSDKGGTLNATATSTVGAANANGVLLTSGVNTGSSFTGGSGTIAANGANGATANGWFVLGNGKVSFAGSGGVLNVNATATKGAAVANGINILGQGGSIAGTTISNSDTINTSATGASGTTPVANSILVVGTGAVTVSNAGGTLSALTNTGGALAYGNAINVNGASAAAITLAGGTIAGNIIEASGGNAITVSGGNTLFNGAINPSKALLGSVTIASTGTLTLGSNGGLGAGNVWTGTFTQPGTLALNASADNTLTGTVHAATATLSGPAALNVNVAGPAFGTSTTYKVVFTTGALSGTWSSVTATDPTFFSAAGVYSANEADITLTRTQLGAVAGLTPNEQQVGNALEKIYEAGGATGPLGSLTTALFALTPAQYANALQQLSGETVGDLAATDAADLQSFMDTIIDHLGDGTGTSASGSAMNDTNSILPGVHPAQIQDGPVSAWGGFVASGAQVSATISGPAYHTHENGVMAGLDFAVDTNAMLGIAVGYNNGGLKTTSDNGSFNVIQVSGYGRYEDPNNQWYALGDVSYGGFSNKLNRTISIPGLATSTVSGKFDSSTVALYGEAGYHLDSDIKLTPYAAISYLNADADPFTETGSFVAPLSVSSASSNSTLSYLGAWFSQTWMSDTLAITPSIKAAWEHDFTSNAWTMTSTFAPVSTAGFSINGSGLSKDAAFIDAGVTLNGGNNIDFRLNYQGRISSDRTESAIVGRIVFKF